MLGCAGLHGQQHLQLQPPRLHGISSAQKQLIVRWPAVKVAGRALQLQRHCCLPPSPAAQMKPNDAGTPIPAACILSGVKTLAQPISRHSHSSRGQVQPALHLLSAWTTMPADEQCQQLGSKLHRHETGQGRQRLAALSYCGPAQDERRLL